MRVWLAIGLCLWFSQASFGQLKKKPNEAGGFAGGVGFELVDVVGKLDSMMGNNLKIISDGNIETIAVLDPRSTIKFTGQAKSSWLPSGMLVRFSARFDGAGKPEAPIKTLDAFQMATRGRMTADEMRDQTPGMYPEGSSIGTATKSLFNDKKTDKKSEKKSTKKTDSAADKKSSAKKRGSKDTEFDGGTPQAYRVVGHVMQVEGNKLLLRAGTQQLTVDIDPAATINVNLPHAMAALPGDSITLKGLRNPRDPKFVQAEVIDIKAAKLLGLDGGQAPKSGRGSARTVKATDKGTKKGADAASGKGKADTKSKK